MVWHCLKANKQKKHRNFQKYWHPVIFLSTDSNAWSLHSILPHTRSNTFSTHPGESYLIPPPLWGGKSSPCRLSLQHTTGLPAGWTWDLPGLCQGLKHPHADGSPHTVPCHPWAMGNPPACLEERTPTPRSNSLHHSIWTNLCLPWTFKSWSSKHLI